MIMRILILVVFLFGTTSLGQEPKWIAVPKLREVSAAQLGAILADIDCRLPAAGLVSSSTYRDSDYGTWAHEATHGVNALIRNQYTKGYGSANAFYCLWGRGCIVQEPRPIKIRDAANFTPSKLRGQIYNLYMVQQAGQWNDQPLYIMDEWTSYINGASYNLSRAEKGQGVGGGMADIRFSVEAGMYSLAVMLIVDANVKSKRMQYDDTQLKLFFAWNWNRMMQLMADSAKHKQFMSPVAYYNVFAKDPSCKDWRTRAIACFGEEWTSNVMRISSSD